jgi:hypothetical protein
VKLTIGHLASTGPASLTPQQREIAELAALASTDREDPATETG